MKLIVGLGNPEVRFKDTRHNLGFKAVDELAKKLEDRVQGIGDSWKLEKKFKAETIQLTYTLIPEPCTLIFAKPQTYMNKSGMAVKALANFFKIKPEDIIIVHDDLDINLGQIKVRKGGGFAGHHGVESIIQDLGTENFIRVKLGIGTRQSLLGEHKVTSFSAEKFVLDPFLPSESSKVKAMVKRAVKAVQLILDKGLEKAQNQYN